MIDLPALVSADRPIVLAPVTDRDSAIMEYRIALNAVIRAIRAEVRESVLPRLAAERSLVRDDEDPDGWFARLSAIAGIAVASATERVRILLGREMKAYTTRFVVTVKKGTGLQLPVESLGIERRSLDLLEVAAAKNAGLIKNVSDDLQAAVKRGVYDSRLNRASAKRLSEELRKSYGIAARRANLIATDQIGSFHSQVTRMHHEAVGVTAYAWSTQQDGRVRELHEGLQGNVYRHGEQTGAEGGLPPGGPIRCRCRMQPVVVPKGPGSKRIALPKRIGGAGGRPLAGSRGAGALRPSSG